MTKYLFVLVGLFLAPSRANAILCGGALYGCTCPSGYTVTCQTATSGAYCNQGYYPGANGVNCAEGNGGVFQGNVNNIKPAETGGPTATPATAKKNKKRKDGSK